jgi:hypothetical protein
VEFGGGVQGKARGQKRRRAVGLAGAGNLFCLCGSLAAGKNCFITDEIGKLTAAWGLGTGNGDAKDGGSETLYVMFDIFFLLGLIFL